MIREMFCFEAVANWDSTGKCNVRAYSEVMGTFCILDVLIRGIKACLLFFAVNKRRKTGCEGTRSATPHAAFRG